MKKVVIKLMLDNKQLAIALRQQGLRLTTQRQAVVDVLTRATEHLTPSDILAQARQVHPKVGLTTVYRTLDLLGKAGFVEKIHMAGGCHSYALSRAGHYHNVVCSECGLVVPFLGCELDDLGEELSRELDFEVTSHWLQFFGRCSSCQKADS